jgi:uroporphyrin-III C-methyltransferase
MNSKVSAGKVYLVGAGPGDPELLTIKAAKTIGLADVLLVDDLVADEILQFARAEARIIYVGKRGGCKSTPQAFIERLMVNEAMQGHTVVRLKGGDPFIFGRGGEECQALNYAGIACEVINGITAGLAGPSSMGIPLTHREFCHGAILVTGHAGDDAVTSPNWPALVATGMPLVIYMGVSRIQEIIDGLIGGGMSASMPVAVVQNATRANQRQITTTLSDLAADIERHQIGSPAIVFVGEAAAMANVASETPVNAASRLAS